MAPIATYVFLDLETTGLPVEECNKTRITELSLIAVKRSHILDSNKGGSPRVQQKLTLCFNPGKLIYPQCTEITGLCNDLLEFESPFNKEAFNTINGFLNLLSKPVCLVAQNGLKFDFPILRNHINSLGVSFADDLLCADCLHAFFDVLKQKSVVVTPSDGYIDNMTSEEDSGVDEVDLYFLSNTLHMQEINERTPKKSGFSNNVLETPRKAQVPRNVRGGYSKVRRRVFWDETSQVSRPKPKESYKLKHIYERIFNRPCIEAHRAENDCTIALQCSVALAKEFVLWVDQNHCLFSEVKPMTIGVPLGQ
ncbi:three-prime repair exonuclease 1 [Epargyreus clarus]|uniref:three-prime repair exonuclease 1 n=1 Tax=Epargyreus clarus TaxID=520877 RepID=UPI003C2EF250